MESNKDLINVFITGRKIDLVVLHRGLGVYVAQQKEAMIKGFRRNKKHMFWVLIKEVLVCLFSMTQLALLSEVSHIPNFFDPRQSDLVVLHFLERHKKCGVEENITDIFFFFFLRWDLDSGLR